MKKTLLFVSLIFVAVSCNFGPSQVENRAVGYAQGTYYQIKYITPDAVDWQLSFDSIFRVIDRSMSTYLDKSTISAINKGETMVEVDSLFLEVLNRSLEIAGETEGNFDPTVGTLVAFWGFGKEKPEAVDTTGLAKLRHKVGYEQVRKKGSRVGIPQGFSLDFNAIAQGYTVDVISRYLEQKGVDRYMVEVGGEVRARGKNIDGEYWRIGIERPDEEMDADNRLQVIISLKNKSLATSGNYRKFWVDEETGIKYAHTIDPITGKPARNRLLSVSIITDQCMNADAYATACMVMGTENAKKFVNSKPELEAYFISSNSKGGWDVYQTEGFKAYVVE